jgi:hypothetical protein
MRFRLRTLLILLAILPPMLAWWIWPTMERLLWPPKPTYRFAILVPSVDYDFAFPIAVPVQAEIEPDRTAAVPTAQ